MAKIAVVLSGCGYLEGSEIQETVLTILALEKQGVEWQGVALNKNQKHVINHLHQGVDSKASPRNILEESARITRGNVIDIADADSDEYDAIIFPGGFGAAKNIMDFAFVGDESYQMNQDVLTFARAFYLADKPAGYICIAPLMIPLVYPEGTKATVGTDENTSAILEKKGAEAILMDATNICVDESVKVVSTPAYMCAKNILEVSQGIDKLVEKVVSYI
ncbi:isoprenoid biosynthesis glyoxalase ElbB [Francisella orientalis]|uniref:Glyoxalase n=1 Tax=Francisella orientalis TaxID=299583 RepID=A0AAP7FTT6_9GAMM|nr:isoprenoid biosynthesis glyoxalase ElbB [Francisella orientalis]AFJ43758.1 isoprenoid biosynthesis protein with amidotransferase-like domain [Francisella orientalis str. Toba 04]AHB98309.1 isoprenoid biosynthesis protein [Francisella orientalis LADL 07-285A]AKN85459.1 Isoprenoid biosynthesis protein with amidotransferase-like domain [Francisella orientalis FNO12]AKN86998.1 Isoprenoid biosynthesis protein with amidotransferase-like domain [Francisella orientalis FNO24]AKN88536.1 Isoprenoid b